MLDARDTGHTGSRPTASVWDEAWDDIGEALQRIDLATTLGWHDVAQRYRRSRVGAFWLTINMGVLIATIGVVFGALFGQPIREFLPYVTVGLIVWGLLHAVIFEGCTGFANSEGIILQVRLPLFTHLLRILWRNVIIFCHNLLILPIVLLVVWRPVDATALMALPGFVLLVVNAAWVALVLAVLCARFRDMTQVMQNVLQVLFYLTPLIWSPVALPERAAGLVTLNPAYHLITLIRAPILGDRPPAASWWIALAMAVAGWAIAAAFFGRYRRRVPYWL